jgi:nitrite reductase (NADH) small subunit
MNWLRVCRLEDLPVLGARTLQHESIPIAIFRNAIDEVFAVLDRCPHQGGPLSQGIVFGNKVACPLHNWTVNLSSGCAEAPDEGCAKTFPTKVDAGVVYLGVSA